jgi:hypothetical protein
MKLIRMVANSICFQLHERRSKQVQFCENFATSKGTKTISWRRTSIGGRS